MPNPEMSEYYFALPFLVAKWNGQLVARTKRNSVEAKLVGGAVHLVVYLFAFQWLLRPRPIWEQILLALPLALLVWIFWLVLFYVNSLVIRLLRASGLMKSISDARAQSLIVLGMTSILAWNLFAVGGWPRFIGLIFLGMAGLNLLAALVLAFGSER